MKRCWIANFSTVILFLVTSSGYTQTTDKQVIENWELSKLGSNEWISVKAPISVHTALFQAKKIADPYLGTNEDSLQWIGQTNWKYRTSFIIKKEDIQLYEHELVFEGLDTYAEVRLNGKLLLNADNMFRSWHSNIQQLLVPGKNIIEIIFTSPVNFIKSQQKVLGINFPGGERVWTRKAQYQFGWDWAPSYITMGIWKPVYINRWKDARIDDMKLSYKLIGLRAGINFEGSFSVKKPGDYLVRFNIGDYGFETELKFEKDTERFSMNFNMNDIELWWPNGMGKQALYDATLELLQRDKIVDRLSRKIGFRTIELVTDKDAKGESFYFRVNGKPMYAKGANYVPPASFPEQVDTTKLKQLIADAKESNFNMLRVWGGGYYESDELYALCDQKGIMIWQDFMFACAMYPGEKDFLDNIKDEAIENVNRIGWHPCMALWCGNNENAEGWARWGWKDGLNTQQTAYLEKSYKEVFNSILPGIVKNSDFDVPYWESSPRWGRGDERYKVEGDAHDWWVWHDARPFEEFEQNVPRFMSEFGFQSYPDMKTIKAFAGKDVHWNDKTLNAHQKHKRGNELIQTYMDREYKKPKDFESYVYLSQRLQSEGIGRGIIAQRLSKPYCMGSLYWQYNDCWPAISWSSVDYYGRWKALQYKAKRIYAPILVATVIKDNIAETSIINDYIEPQTLTLNIHIYTLNGKEYLNAAIRCQVESNSSKLYQNTELTDFINNYGKSNLCIYTTVSDSTGVVISDDMDFLLPAKQLRLSKDALKFSFKKEDYGYSLRLKASAIVPGVWISSGLEGKFSDNGFDMVPGEKLVKFYTSMKGDALPEFKVRSLRDGWE